MDELIRLVNSGAKEADLVRAYALALVTQDLGDPKWAEVNAAIIDRKSKTALMRIKRNAWDMIEVI